MSALDALLLKSHVWRGDARAEVAVPSVPSGHGALDALLPGNGWPRAALTELLVPRPGIGELSLLLPALARLSAQSRWITLVGPPHLPYPPALARAGLDLSRLLVVRASDSADALWAMEQALSSGACSAVIGWPASVNERALRRLQLAVERGGGFGAFISRGPGSSHSLASLRLQLLPADGQLGIRVLKVRGHGIGATLTIDPQRPQASLPRADAMPVRTVRAEHP